MTFKRLARGEKGEDLAAAFLNNKGLRIIDRNVRLKCGEIDLICQDNDTLVFVEVKTRTSNRFGSPLEAVDHRKISQVSRAAQEYLLRRKIADQPMRFDVVAILLKPKLTISHLENAFELP